MVRRDKMIDPKQNENKDFTDFIKSKKSTPSPVLDEFILRYVQRELSPSHIQVFIKIVFIQAFIGVLTLLFCPQFNLSLTNNYDLFHFFHHKFGEAICMIICGSIFMGSGAVFSAYILKSEEVQKIKESELLYYFSMSLLALSVFYIFGAQIYLELALYWILGSSIGGLLAFEINRNIRLKSSIT